MYIIFLYRMNGWVHTFKIFEMYFDDECDINGIDFQINNISLNMYLDSVSSINHILSLTPCIINFHQNDPFDYHLFSCLNLIASKATKWTVHYSLVDVNEHFFSANIFRARQMVGDVRVLHKPEWMSTGAMYVVFGNDFDMRENLVQARLEGEALETTQYEVVGNRTLKFPNPNFDCLMFQMDAMYIIYVL